MMLTPPGLFTVRSPGLYGLEGIPEEWRKKIAPSELILRFADQLFELALNKA
jgi:hypothetical protein